MSTSTDYLTALDSRSERRFYPRSSPSRPIYIPFGANNLCMLLNLSENGFLISTPGGLDRNSVYRVSIRLNGVPNPIEVPVRTIWTTESRERAGIQILDLSDYDREQIRKWQALESTREKPALPIGPKPAVGEELVEETRVEQKVAAPAVPIVQPPPKRPPAPRIAAAAARAGVPIIAEPRPSTEAQVLRAPSGPIIPPRRKKSEALALIAWILVGAVTCVGVALLMRPDLFGKILMHAPNGGSQIIAEAPAPDSASVRELDPPSSPANANSAAAHSGPTIDETKKAAQPLHANTDAAAAATEPSANRNHFSVSPSRPNLNGTSTAARSSNSANKADAGASLAAKSVGGEPVSNSGDTARDAAADKTMTADNAANPNGTTANVGDAQVANATPSAVTTAPMTTPAPAPTNMPVTPALSGKSAISGSIGDSSPRGSEAAASLPASGPASGPASNSTGLRSAWGSSGPVAAGRSSLLRSRPDPGASPVVHMDVAENRVMEITPPRGISSSFVTLPGERVLEIAGMTVHIRRAVRVPSDRWLWHSKKQLVLGELSSRVDPQRAHGSYGSVTLQAMIDKDGSVGDLKPVDGSSALLPSVTRAVHEWHYEPSYLDGKPVETRAEIEIDFHPGTNPRP
jgi:Gram-negative bacterial TonB protein C-terminal/PilZ domain